MSKMKRKRITLNEITSYSYKGVILSEVHFISGLHGSLCYADLPNKAVLVAETGSRFMDLGLVKDMKLRWASFFYARPPKDWEGSYEEYIYEKDLPVFCGRALRGMAVRFRTARTGREILVVWKDAWHSRWEEVKKYLLKHGYAIPEEKFPELDLSITLGGDPEFEVVLNGEVVPAR
ncbi:MAG: hypothetical protein JHC25_03515, partial [Thermodesulfobacterium sp.]|nr:hypothetical protein [Thermodesulfobacterium sp.]